MDVFHWGASKLCCLLPLLALSQFGAPVAGGTVRSLAQAHDEYRAYGPTASKAIAAGTILSARSSDSTYGQVDPRKSAASTDVGCATEQHVAVFRGWRRYLAGCVGDAGQRAARQ